MKQKEQDKEWGDHVDITALSELYNVRVRVYEYDEQMEKMSVRSDHGDYPEAMGLPIILLARHGQMHYNIIHDPSTKFPRHLRNATFRESIAKLNGITCVSLRQLRLIKEEDGGPSASIEGDHGIERIDPAESASIQTPNRVIQDEIGKCRAMLEEKEKLLVEQLQRYWVQQEEMDKIKNAFSVKRKQAERLKVVKITLKRKLLHICIMDKMSEKEQKGEDTVSRSASFVEETQSLRRSSRIRKLREKEMGKSVAEAPRRKKRRMIKKRGIDNQERDE